MTVSQPNTVWKPSNTIVPMAELTLLSREIEDMIVNYADAGLGWEDIVVKLHRIGLRVGKQQVRRLVLKRKPKRTTARERGAQPGR
jgi:hypothetical protein